MTPPAPTACNGVGTSPSVVMIGAVASIKLALPASVRLMP